jgi:hypothetical protein
MELILLAVLVFGNGYQFQKTYEYCKEEVQYEGSVCKIHKKIKKAKDALSSDEK